MALSAIRETLDGLSEDVAKEYTKGDDGKFHLQVEGGEDIGALKRAKDHEKRDRVKAEESLRLKSEALDALQAELDDIRRGNIPKGDVEKLEASWKDKLSKREGELTTEIEAMRGSLETLLVDNVAQQMATAISIAPELMLPHIRSRLKAERGENGYTTRVVDATGAISAMTIDDLSKEFIANPSYAKVIIGSKASGGGASGSHSGGGAPNANFNAATASPKDLAAHITAKKSTGG